MTLLRKCFFCKKKKTDVEYIFACHAGCKSCADEYMEKILNRK